MQTIAYLSDIHLNFIQKNEIINLANKINNTQANIAVIAGDISEFPSLYEELDILNENTNIPIYFVHGNHDAFNSSFVELKQQSYIYSSLNDKIKWIGHENQEPIHISNDTCLIGEDNWYDGRYGNFFKFPYFEMPDFGLIKELKKINSRTALLKTFNELGDNAANRLKNKINQAVLKYNHIVCLMHIPPFAEASVYGKNPSPDYSIPFFANKAMGEMLLDMKEIHPTKTFVVLAGHSHYPAELHIDKLHVYVAGAKYRYPEVYTTVEVK